MARGGSTTGGDGQLVSLCKRRRRYTRRTRPGVGVGVIRTWGALKRWQSDSKQAPGRVSGGSGSKADVDRKFGVTSLMDLTLDQEQDLDSGRG